MVGVLTQPPRHQLYPETRTVYGLFLPKRARATSPATCTPSLQLRAVWGGDPCAPRDAFKPLACPPASSSPLPKGFAVAGSLRRRSSARQTAPLCNGERSRGAKKPRGQCWVAPTRLPQPGTATLKGSALPCPQEPHPASQPASAETGSCPPVPPSPAKGGCDGTERVTAHPSAGLACAHAGNRTTRHLSTRSTQPQDCFSFLCRYTPTHIYIMHALA